MGQAIGLNVFLLFNGFGFGALLFGQLLGTGFNATLLWFALGALMLGNARCGSSAAKCHGGIRSAPMYLKLVPCAHKCLASKADLAAIKTGGGDLDLVWKVGNYESAPLPISLRTSD